MIEILNLNPGDFFAHSIAYVFGKCHDSSNEIQLTDAIGKTIKWKVRKFYFKAFVKLQNGENQIEIKSDNSSLKFVLIHGPRNNHTGNNYVRVLYVVCNDDNGDFQSPNADTNSISSALKRISLSVQLLQTFISELMYKQFGIRKTFNLFKMDEKEDACEVFHTKIKLSDALAMKSEQLYLHLANEISTSIFDQKSKYLAVLSFTRFEKMPGVIGNSLIEPRGFCALGCEWLAVYGNPCLFTWAEDLNNLQSHFDDQTYIEISRFAFRSTYWASYSTTLGSMLHELSHMFDLGHNQHGIMARGYNNLYTFFNIDFQNCTCYEKIDKNKISNDAIERIVKREKEFKINGDLFKQETTLAMFKSNETRDFSIIWNLVWNKQKKLLITHENRSRSECTCLSDCIYEDTSMVILYNHKWMNDFNIGTDSAIEIDQADGFLICNSSSDLVLYELRDIEGNVTEFQFLKHMSNKKSCKIPIHDANYCEIFVINVNGDCLKMRTK